MKEIVYYGWGTSCSLDQRRKSFKNWLSSVKRDMEQKYYEKVEEGMETVEDVYDIGSNYYVCIECVPWGNKVDIYSAISDKECSFPNIEEAILRSLPTYDKIVERVEEDRLEDEALKDTYRSICDDNGWDYNRCNV